MDNTIFNRVQRVDSDTFDKEGAPIKPHYGRKNFGSQAVRRGLLANCILEADKDHINTEFMRGQTILRQHKNGEAVNTVFD